jgi:hypothetical protein
LSLSSIGIFFQNSPFFKSCLDTYWKVPAEMLKKLIMVAQSGYAKVPCPLVILGVKLI